MNELLKLENQLCFKVYAASRMITKSYKPLLDKLNLTYPQYLVMLVLWERDSISVKELGEKLYLDSGTLTPLLKKLEKKEFVERRRDKEDERSVRIKLTKLGRSLEVEALEVPQNMIKTNLISKMQYTELMEILGSMLEK